MTVSSVLPNNLPVPTDDGQADHLLNFKIPVIKLRSSSNSFLEISEFLNLVLFIFPKAGSPLEEPTDYKVWDAIPGARGCTPQSCSFRDLNDKFKACGFDILGLSVQPCNVLKEFKERNHIPYELLSDENLIFAKTLRLPTFTYKNRELIKRITLVIQNGKVSKVFYPIFPADKNPQSTLEFVKSLK